MKSLALAAILATSAGVASAEYTVLSCTGNFYHNYEKQYEFSTTVTINQSFEVITTGGNLFDSYFRDYKYTENLEKGEFDYGTVSITDDSFTGRKVYSVGDIYEETVININRYTGELYWIDTDAAGSNKNQYLSLIHI